MHRVRARTFDRAFSATAFVGRKTTRAEINEYLRGGYVLRKVSPSYCPKSLIDVRTSQK